MDKNAFPLSTKPLLLTSAMALVLAACGGSGGEHHAPSAEQLPVPEHKTPAPEREPEQQQDPGQKPAPEHKPEPKPDTRHDNAGTPPPKKPDVPPQKPDPAPELQDPGNVVEPPVVNRKPSARGPAFIANTLVTGGQPATSRHLVRNVFKAPNPLIPKVTGNSITFADAAIDLIYENHSLGKDLELKSDDVVDTNLLLKEQGGKDLTVRLIYKAKKFGYADAQALHYYGRLADRDFSVAYSIGAIADPKAVHDLKPDSEGKVIYRGPASFRPYVAAPDVLNSGTATLTLHHDQRKLDAVIDVPAIGKNFAFTDIDYKAVKTPYNTSFLQESGNKDRGIRGYFYGDRAQHIGGAYYVPEGGGAFITENVTGKP